MKELEELKKKISEDPSSFIIILGAGASIPAGLPSWTELKDILCEAIFDVKDDHDECKQIVDDINNSKSLWTMFKKLRNILGQLRYEKEILQSLDPDNLDTPPIKFLSIFSEIKSPCKSLECSMVSFLYFSIISSFVSYIIAKKLLFY